MANPTGINQYTKVGGIGMSKRNATARISQRLASADAFKEAKALGMSSKKAHRYAAGKTPAKDYRVKANTIQAMRSKFPFKR